MKKILLSLAAVGMSVAAFAGTGTLADPYSVEEVIALGKDLQNTTTIPDGGAGVYVEGYIVGYMPTNTNSTVLSATVFDADSDAATTNIVLADSSSEDQYAYCIGIQLPSGAVRNALNLLNNPANLGHKVILSGDVMKYCGAPGLRNTKTYEWVGEAPNGGSQGNYSTGSAEAPLTVTEFLAMGTPNPAVAGTYLTGYIVGFVDSNNSNTFTFSATDAVNTNLIIAASADETSKANSVPVQLPSGEVRAALNLVDNPGNLGKQVTLYGSHEAYFSVNALKSVTHYWWGATGEPVNDTPSTPNPNQPAVPTGEITVAAALEYINAGGTGTITVKGYVTDIDAETSNPAQYGDINYYISDDLNASNKLYIYNGYFLGGEKFTSIDQLKVGDLVVVEGTAQLYGTTPELNRGSKIISLNGETAGDTPSTPPSSSNPDDYEGTLQPFQKDLGFPEGASAAVPTEPTTVKASDTGIEYTLFGANVNTGNYLMVAGKVVKGAYISWSLDFPIYNLLMTTTGGCSTNASSMVNIYANDNLIVENFAVNSQNFTYNVDIPEAYQAAGTVYRVESATDKYNQQFASFKYVTGESGVDEVLAADDSEAVYYNLQGQRVLNPERGIFVKVVGGKAVKVVK